MAIPERLEAHVFFRKVAIFKTRGAKRGGEKLALLAEEACAQIVSQPYFKVNGKCARITQV